MSKPIRWFVLVVWLALLGVFAYRQVTTDRTPPGLAVAIAASNQVEEDAQEWFGIYVTQPGGEKLKIGYSAIKRESTATGYQTEVNTYMRLSIQGAEQVMRTESRFVTDLEYKLQYVDFLMRSDKVKFKVIGTVRGNQINLEIETAGGTQRQAITLPEVPVMPDDIAMLMAGEGELTVGRTIELPFFDPMTRRYDKARVRVAQRIEHQSPDGAKTVAYRLETQMAGMTAVSVIDEKGRTLEQTMANITLLREPRQTALTENWRDQPVDLPDVAKVRVDRLIQDAREATYVQVRLSGVSLDDLPIGDERQVFADNVLTVEVKAPPAKGAFQIPYRGDDTKALALLQPSPLVESDDPAIVEQARKIVPVNVDAVTAARAIANWVHKNLEKKALVSMTSAKDVLILRRGDCNEHASLFTALARAAGLPAEIHVGLVYLDGAFYYHAWNGVYVGEWISIDPTFGQFPADATHLRIVSGGLDRQVDIVRLMGAVRLEVLAAR